jgi:hypothetical protein
MARLLAHVGRMGVDRVQMGPRQRYAQHGVHVLRDSERQWRWVVNDIRTNSALDTKDMCILQNKKSFLTMHQRVPRVQFIYFFVTENFLPSELYDATSQQQFFRGRLRRAKRDC